MGDIQLRRYSDNSRSTLNIMENSNYSNPRNYNYQSESEPNVLSGNSSSRRSYIYENVIPYNSRDKQGNYLNYYHRTTSVHRNVFKHGAATCNFRAVPSSLEHRKKWLFCTGYNVQDASLQERADDIAKCMELDDALMENTHESELLRRGALRDMPQCLTIKRIIKKNLSLSINKQSRGKPISCLKGLRYNISMKWLKVRSVTLWRKRSDPLLLTLGYHLICIIIIIILLFTDIIIGSMCSCKFFMVRVFFADASFESTASEGFALNRCENFELWYSSLKQIEGHFGSGVATYFKYFRWMFIMNFLISIVALLFVVFPQLLFENFTSSTAISKNWFNWEVKQSTNNDTFKVNDLFTAEGYFTDTILFYGHYTNKTIKLISTQGYSIPYAYFFTTVCVYIASFIVLSLRMAKSYRKSFIETQDGLKNNFAHKIFCGWDYSVATEKAANLKISALYHELKELLSESLETVKNTSCLQEFYTKVIQTICNVIIIFLLGGTGYVLWLLLKENTIPMNESSANVGIIIAIVINIIMWLFPIAFSFIVHYEDYKHPRAALYITLLRTFLLKIVLVGTFLTFWLKHSTKQKCWETAIGQHIFRLILFDFFFSVVLASFVKAVCYLIYKNVWKGIGTPTFDIARYTLQLLYNQTLFWVGFYFSPLLAVVVVLKLWVSWYICQTCTLNFCEPYSKSWKAAQTQTLFLILSFLSLLLVIITLGYIVVDVEASKCGPLRNYSYMYELILKGIFQLEQHNVFWKVLMYFTKPGAVALILLAMCVAVYYLRAKTLAQKGVVNILRDMLVLEAKDKEFLLKTFSKVAEQCNLPTEHKVYSVYENVTDVWSTRKRNYYKAINKDSCSSFQLFEETNSSTEIDQPQLIDQSPLLLKGTNPLPHKKKHR